MTLTYIWTGFFLVGFVAALVQWLGFGDATVFKRIIDGTFDAARAVSYTHLDVYKRQRTARH